MDDTFGSLARSEIGFGENLAKRPRAVACLKLMRGEEQEVCALGMHRGHTGAILSVNTLVFSRIANLPAHGAMPYALLVMAAMLP